MSGLDFSLQKGAFLGVIGGTGAGKSTLVQLLARLYRPQKGDLQIFTDQQSPKTIREWRDLVHVVPQKAELFQGTIRSNILLGISEEVSDEQLWRALEIAQASDFVAQKEGQLNAEVTAFGRNFSGGQRQRLTIARAIVKASPFLVLDDSTSALDYLTESKLLKAITSELETTLIMISQRTNSLRTADKVLVLDKGRQAGFASHDALLSTNDLYQSIHLSQHQKGDQDAR